MDRALLRTPPTYTVRIAEDKVGLRLDVVLSEALPDVSRTRLRRLMAEGRVCAGSGQVVNTPSLRVSAGETFTVDVPTPTVTDIVEAQPIPLSIVFEDTDLIVVNKPAGLVVHPGAGNPDRTLVNALLAHCKGHLASTGGPRRPGVVHRLDKDTSGLIVTAKTDAAYAGLVPQFSEHSIERAYFALVWGTPIPDRGRIEGNIGRDPRHRTRMAVVHAGGKPAATTFRVIHDFDSAASLLECRPETGRTHQIRVHLASRGHPIIGDSVYAGGRRRGRARSEAVARVVACLHRQALHAHLMGLTHPISGKRLVFEAPLPFDIKSVVDNLKRV